MNGKTKRAAYTAVLTALGVLLLLLANLVPAGRLALLALASLPVCAALMLFGAGWGAGVCAVTAILGFLLFPGTAAIGYAAFFGWYPIVKSLCERIRNPYAGWGLKFLAYGAAFALYWFLARELFAGARTLPWAVLLLLGAAVFFVFDRAYSLLIRFYLERLARYLGE